MYYDYIRTSSRGKKHCHKDYSQTPHIINVMYVTHDFITATTYIRCTDSAHCYLVWTTPNVCQHISHFQFYVTVVIVVCYCTELYNSVTKINAAVLDCPINTEEDNFPILREKVEAAVKSLKKRKSAGVDNMPAELIQADWRFAYSMDPINVHHTSKKRQPTMVSILPDNQPHQSPK